MDFLRNFINDNSYKIIINSSGIYIKNYIKLLYMYDTSISFLLSNKKIILKGKELKLKKILDREALIIGIINNIEVYDV